MYILYCRQTFFSDDEPLPIGKACSNSRVLVLNEQDELVKNGEEGELCVVGTGLALGYYNNPEKTDSVFTQNPINLLYPERMYRTGDIVKYNEKNELIYMSRKDFQIKHMGYRIELGEIENALGGKTGIDNCACVYDNEAAKIIACYTGTKMDKGDLQEYFKDKLPVYMIPAEFLWYEQFPYNSNDKIDRIALAAEAKGRYQ